MKKRTNIDIKEKQYRFGLTLIFSLIIFCILVITLSLFAVTAYILFRADALRGFTSKFMQPRYFVTFLVINSVIIGVIVATITNKIPLRPFKKLIEQINRLGSGDYTARLELRKPIKNLPGMDILTGSFNSMAEELQSTEMLRSDFINNFSHEFKTPIVSIAGFAKLLRRGNLSDRQRDEYLAIIEEESLRLSYMATNVLNLTKIENQAILTDLTTYNLSEQIRDAILLLENKWTAKNLELHIDFDEHEISANGELLKQVWINLLDNAIKFSPDYGILEVKIEEEQNIIDVSVSNNGEPIPEEVQNKIFNKFYQADESHSSEGNEIGITLTWISLIFIILDSIISACAVYRMSRRLGGIEPSNSFWKYIDRHYPDERVNNVYPNMKFNIVRYGDAKG
ncbi:MAG: HAMP domain-containing histidine kinase [Clostridia bacterium]|nr:HAMP domain-containing histidine kinase [Clostridia bacterium]